MNTEDYLAHHGIKGMKWGVRRYQNKDGSLTEAGKKRYYNKNGSLTNKGYRAYRKNKDIIIKNSPFNKRDTLPKQQRKAVQEELSKLYIRANVARTAATNERSRAYYEWKTKKEADPNYMPWEKYKKKALRNYYELDKKANEESEKLHAAFSKYILKYPATAFVAEHQTITPDKISEDYEPYLDDIKNTKVTVFTKNVYRDVWGSPKLKPNDYYNLNDYIEPDGEWVDYYRWREKHYY